MAEFYQKVKQELEKGISNVSIRSKEVLENLKINKQIEALKAQMEASQLELGQSVYDMIKENNLNQEVIVQKCEMITGLQQLLYAKQENLNQLHLEIGTALGKTYCNGCKAEIDDGAKFCGQCGEKIPEPESSEEK